MLVVASRLELLLLSSSSDVTDASSEESESSIDVGLVTAAETMSNDVTHNQDIHEILT